jgi:hypothetical protein
MKLCGWTTRSMLTRYNITAARNLEEGVSRLAEYLNGTNGTKRETNGRPQDDKMVELNGIEPSTS